MKFAQFVHLFNGFNPIYFEINLTNSMGKETISSRKLPILVFVTKYAFLVYFMLSGRISRNSSENIFRSYTGTTSENTDFHVLLA